MPGLQDLAIRLGELLEIPQGEALSIARRLVPVMLLEDVAGKTTVRVPGLLGYPGFGLARSVGAAGNRGHVQIFNPADSGVVVHVEKGIFTGAQTTTCDVRRFDTALTSLSADLQYRDFRKTGLPAAEMRFQDSIAALGTLLGDFDMVAAQLNLIPFDAVLGEGHGLLVNTATTSRAVEGWWFWREV